MGTTGKTIHNFKKLIDLSTNLAFSSSRGEVLCICLLPVDGGLLDLRGLLAHRRLEEAEGHHRPSEGESVRRRNSPAISSEGTSTSRLKSGLCRRPLQKLSSSLHSPARLEVTSTRLSTPG